MNKSNYQIRLERKEEQREAETARSDIRISSKPGERLEDSKRPPLM